MVLNNIEKLVEKYDNGETTLQEEQQLRDYFSQENVPQHLEAYKSMFQYFSITQEEQYTKDVPLEPRKTISLYQWISVAAVIIVMLGIFTQVGIQPQSRTLADLSLEERKAYDQTKELFAMLSNNLGKGTEGLEALNMVTTNFDKGTKNVAYLGEISNATNKILKTN